MNVSEESESHAEPPPASASAAERYLSAWHGRHPDAGRLFADHDDAAGHSSLERLAADAESATAVVDVGCGSGRLLELCHRSNPSAQQFGIDLNHADLHIAAELLPGARFVQARAQALPLRADSVDCVLCHMALMLMDDPSQVLAEVSRVLGSGGIFAAVTQRLVFDTTAEAVFAALRPLFEQADSARLPPPLANARTTDEGALRTLAAPWFAEVSVQPFDVGRLIEREGLREFLFDAIYGVDALPQEGVAGLLRKLELPDPVPWTTPMLYLSARM